MSFPHKLVDGYQYNWCSFGWFLGWAINSIGPAECRYLEWGPGWSTKYAISLGVPKKNIFSVESDEQWFSAYRGLNVNMILADGPKTEDVGERVKESWYDPFPGQTFDVVLVDGGHKRDECVLQAARILSPHGFVVVHDTLGSPEHRRASRCSNLRVVAENWVRPGTTLLARQGRRLSVREWLRLVGVSAVSYVVWIAMVARSRIARLFSKPAT
jgi:hypothetical protein